MCTNNVINEILINNAQVYCTSMFSYSNTIFNFKYLSLVHN